MEWRIKFVLWLLAVSHVASVTSNRGRTSYDVNKHDDTSADCHLLNQVQSSMIRILSTHIAYGKSIKRLETNAGSLALDMSKFKRKITRLERAQEKTNDNVNNMITLRNISMNEVIQPRGNVFNTRFRPLKRSENEHAYDSSDVVAMATRIADLESTAVSLTLVIKTQNDHIKKLDRHQHQWRHLYHKLNVTVAMLSKERNPGLLEHFVRKQKEINVQVVKRLRHLEDGGELLPASDSPNNDVSTGCPPKFVRHFTSCYMFANTTANWINAEKLCQGAHPLAHLVGIETEEEEDFIIKYRNHNSANWSSAYLWTGGQDMSREGTWTWVGTGRTLGYTNWRQYEPNNHNSDQHCIYLGDSVGSHGWDDWHCYGARLNFVCEIRLGV